MLLVGPRSRRRLWLWRLDRQESVTSDRVGLLAPVLGASQQKREWPELIGEAGNRSTDVDSDRILSFFTAVALPFPGKRAICAMSYAHSLNLANLPAALNRVAQRS
ncbi:MAG: hypothetical protein ACREX3_00080 [Gammaproteobacteria bacterium]